nr:MFS transporter [uncultured Lichenicoccus sp.]
MKQVIRTGQAPASPQVPQAGTVAATPRVNLALLALAIASFGIGTTEFVIMGLLPQLAADLDVSIPSAGLLVSGYALGVTIGAPILAIATARLPRKSALLWLMGLFVAGNACCALAPSYTMLMLARVLTAFCHGAFFGTAAVVAADQVPRHKRAQALALVFAGLTLANVFGVPLGTAFGQWAGWRSTFWAVCAIGILAAAAIQLWLPRGEPATPMRLASEFRVLRRRQVLLTMTISILTSASLFSVFTYIAPILQDLAGLSPHAITWALLLFGGGITLGNLLGGRLADWKLLPAVIMTLVALIGILCVFAFTCHSGVAAVVTLFLWGMIDFALVPPLQFRVVEQASDAPNLASTLNQGAFNLGNAIGAWLGGLVVLGATPGLASPASAAGYGLLPWLGASLAVVALGTALLALSGERRDRFTSVLAGDGTT